MSVILHLDGDAFFVACEVARNPRLRGQPVVTGQERGIACALSYEAKAIGVRRGMPITQIKRLYPQTVILPSDYRAYSLYSQRFYAIVRHYASRVEESGIDECFVELDDFDAGIVNAIRHDLQIELNLTFSAGLANTKVLAKVGSKWQKPDGFTVIPPEQTSFFLSRLPLERVWGIGPRTATRLNKLGLITAADLAQCSHTWICDHLNKPEREIWSELRGQKTHPLTVGPRPDYQSISHTRTFVPPSAEQSFLLSCLSRNVESASRKLRRYNLLANRVKFSLKTQNFCYYSIECKLIYPTATPAKILTTINHHFNKIFRPGITYRATGVTLNNLVSSTQIEQDMFGQVNKSLQLNNIFRIIDRIGRRYGSRSVFLASSLRSLPRRLAKTKLTNDKMEFSLNIGEVLK